MNTRQNIWLVLWSAAAILGQLDSLHAQHKRAIEQPPSAAAIRPFGAAARYPHQKPALNAMHQTRPQARLALRSQPPLADSFASQLRRLPPVAPRQPLNSPHLQPVNGTWRDDGQHIVINLNGQQLRLEKSDDTPNPLVNAPPSGEVYGRLSHKGRPVVNCKVALLPLKKDWNGYHVDGSVTPPVGKTDSDGVYRIEGVASGPYKLTWLPEGERQWIRRIAIRPDVNVRTGDIAHVKEIRKSLRTVN